MRMISLSESLKSALLPATAGQQADTVRTIAMVGARTDGGNLSPDDAGYLTDVFGICADRGLSVSSDVRVGAINLEYGHDFLKEPVECDMVIFSYVFYEPSLVGVYRIPENVRQSPMAKDGANWHEALLKTGANVAFNVFNGDGRCELPTKFLSQEPYNLVDTVPSKTTNLNFALLMR